MGDLSDFSTAVLRSLQDPTRRKILELLTEPQDATTLATSLEMSRPGVDKHLGVLMNAHLVHRQVEAYRGKPVYVYQTSENAIDLVAGVERLLTDFLEMTRSKYQHEMDILEEDFLRGRLSPESFRTVRRELEEKIKALMSISSISYVEEARKIVTDWMSERTSETETWEKTDEDDTEEEE